MGTWTKDELEQQFAVYKERSQRAADSGDWITWAEEQFTEDAVYVEHHYGRFEGRKAIGEWISSCMGEFPGSAMPGFPSDWHVIDEDKGWVICQIQNLMPDPGDGSEHKAANLTILHYAGDGKWSYEEDVYNPAHFATMLEGWIAARRAAKKAAQDA